MLLAEQTNAKIQADGPGIVIVHLTALGEHSRMRPVVSRVNSDVVKVPAHHALVVSSRHDTCTIIFPSPCQSGETLWSWCLWIKLMHDQKEGMSCHLYDMVSKTIPLLPAISYLISSHDEYMMLPEFQFPSNMIIKPVIMWSVSFTMVIKQITTIVKWIQLLQLTAW